MAFYRIIIVNKINSWIGCTRGDLTHQHIIDTYNAKSPLPRGYRVKYTDKWCATTVCAAFIEAGYAELCPLECSCYYMIEKAKAMGIWKERDDYRPSLGDIIMYDWDDDGIGDDTGAPEHVGIVTSITGDSYGITEGNYKNGCGVRYIKHDSRYIRGYITPKFDGLAPVKTDTPIAKTASKSADSFSKDVAGSYMCVYGSNMRHGPSILHSKMIVIPKDAVVKNYGYYTDKGKTRWLYVEYTENRKTYTGFVSMGDKGQYLSKIKK